MVNTSDGEAADDEPADATYQGISLTLRDSEMLGQTLKNENL